nr:unnamed protein product [Callosobruchus analis]
MTCANEVTSVWLRETVKSLVGFWEAAHLTAVEPKDLLNMPMLPELKVDHWHLLSSKQQEGKGVILSFSIDQGFFGEEPLAGPLWVWEVTLQTFEGLDGGDQGSLGQPGTQ